MIREKTNLKREGLIFLLSETHTQLCTLVSFGDGGWGGGGVVGRVLYHDVTATYNNFYNIMIKYPHVIQWYSAKGPTLDEVH